MEKLINELERFYNPSRVTQINLFSLSDTDISWITSLTEETIDALCCSIENAKEIDISSWD